MNLKQLKTFLLVAETGSLSKASDRLNLAQPALSRHIRLLEDEIGVELFKRHGRGMELTEAGAELLGRAGGLITQLESLFEDVRADSTALRGRVAIGLTPSAAPILAPRVVSRVMSEHPGISLRIVEAFAGHLIDWLQRGEIEIAILAGPGVDLHLRTIGLLYEDYVLVGPSDSDLSVDVPVTLAEVAKLDLILSSGHHGMRKVLDGAARKAGVTLNAKIEVDSSSLLTTMVAAGLGYTVGTISSIHEDVARGRFKVAPLTKPTVTRQLILGLPTSRPDTRATTAVKEIVLHETADLIERGIWQATADTELLTALQPKRR